MLALDRIRTAWASASPKERLALLESPEFPVDILVEVVTENIPYEHGRRERCEVQQLAYHHPNLPTEIMPQLFRTIKDSPHVQVASEYGFLFNPNFPVELFDTSSRLYTGHDSQTTDGILRKILAHPDCHSGFCYIAIKSYNIDVRLALASSKALPESLFPVILKDSNIRVSSQALANHRIPLEVISRLFICDGVIRADVHPQILRGIVRRLPSGGALRDAILRLSARNDRASRTTVAEYTEDPAEADKLCFDHHPIVRKKASENPLSSEEARVAAILIDGTFSTGLL
jgi:hypothetical protein